MRIKSGPMGARVAALAAKRHGVVSRKELLHLGCPAATIKRWTDAGHLHRVHRGVFAVGHPELSVEGRWLAATLACGPLSLISHTSAAQLWGLFERTARQRVHVTIVGRSGRATPGLSVHRPRELPRADLSVRFGIPATSPTRTIWDLATLVSRAQVSRALDEASRLSVLDRRRLGELADAKPRHRGSAEVRRWLAAARAPLSETRSRLEAMFLRVCRDHSLPMPATNVPVLDYEVDFLWRPRTSSSRLMAVGIEAAGATGTTSATQRWHAPGTSSAATPGPR
jgi:hypothetical protein